MVYVLHVQCMLNAFLLFTNKFYMQYQLYIQKSLFKGNNLNETVFAACQEVVGFINYVNLNCAPI